MTLFIFTDYTAKALTWVEEARKGKRNATDLPSDLEKRNPKPKRYPDISFTSNVNNNFEDAYLLKGISIVFFFLHAFIKYVDRLKRKDTRLLNIFRAKC